MKHTQHSSTKIKWIWILDLLLVFVLLVGAYLRFVGSNWGDFEAQHPDENFMGSVVNGIQPLHNLGDYFNSATSTLNPAVVGYPAYVYGTVPLFIVRFASDFLRQLGQTKMFSADGFTEFRLLVNNMTWLGRIFSGLMDLGTILLLYLIARRFYGRVIALLASAFSALTVMQIQQSHFFTVDNFYPFFMFLALYVAAVIATDDWEVRRVWVETAQANSFGAEMGTYLKHLFRDRLTYLCIAFGVALGLATASKLNAAAIAVTLPVALLVRYFRTSYTAPEAAAGTDLTRFKAFFARALVCLVIGTIISILAFRIFQPYAFTGPGFFGLKPNAAWIAKIQEQRSQASPNADLPWALQWARRTHLYSFQNLTVWGLGLPLGILAWAGFLWMGWRILKGEWRRHLLLWSWTAFYFLWQSLQFNPTMRYQLPIYPLLGMMAAWVVVRLWENGRRQENAGELDAPARRARLSHLLAVFSGALVLALTAAWGYGFTRIYVRPETRVAASHWIFANVPGPINVEIQTADGSTYQEPIPFNSGTYLQLGVPFLTSFAANQSGTVTQIVLPYVGAHVDLNVTLWQNASDPIPLASGILSTPSQTLTGFQILQFPQPANLSNQQTYTLKVKLVTPESQVKICGPLQLFLQTGSRTVQQSLPALPQCVVSANQPYQTSFVAQSDGVLNQIDFGHSLDLSSAAAQTVSLAVAPASDTPAGQELADASATADFSAQTDPRGVPLTLTLDRPVKVTLGQTVYMNFKTSGGTLALSGGTVANETDYDYTLPFRTTGYDPFGGLYRGDLNLQVYWDDNADKLTRFMDVLNQTDYILLPTNHQYGQITRIPERYPLTTVYYRDLIGCPVNKDIIWCYRVATPGMFHGSLGFNLVATFSSYPTLGPLQINDQGAEEAFTFYDHPKVMIFRKNADYDPAKVEAILGAVDFNTAVHLTPGQANTYKSLMLPADHLTAQQEGGTWSQLFDWNALQNRYPGLGGLIWYLVIFALGLVTYPLVRAALPGLADRGYPLARLVGLLLWAWFSWLAGSLGGTYSRLTIGLSLGVLVLISAVLAYRQREGLKQEWRTRKKYFLLVEGLFLTFFLIDLLIRLGNSDLWHPAKGGERPMDFAYLNAILKSTTFPPYDPWFAGGYINYYYYGYVIVGTPVKLLGFVPAIAYNFILPTLFAMLAMGAFSVGWNLLALRPGAQEGDATPSDPTGWRAFLQRPSLYCGLAAASAMVLLGNLGVVRMFYQGFQQLAAPGGVIDKANIFQRIGWAVHGFFLSLGGLNLPYGPGDWYWNPSRVLPANSGGPITEFPLFTFVYSDLHAHMIAYPLTVLAIAWVLSVVLARAKWRGWLEGALGLGLGALVIGALYPTNAWDFYTYLLLGGIVLAYTVWRYADFQGLHLPMSGSAKRWILSLGAPVLLAGLSLLFYQPFWHWFAQSYNSFEAWTGARSDIWSYLTHWGVFLFFIVSWMIWETREWLATTPLSSLRKLRPYQELILGAVLLLVLLLVVQQIWVMLPSQNASWKGVTILWLALPLAAWAGVLILRPGLADTKRLVLFMIGTSLVLTMVVELLVVKGDIGRQNTVFKFYCQAWIMLGISAAAAFGWLLGELRKWLPGWRGAWQTAALLLVAGAALFIVFGVTGKIRDRIAINAPHTLDSMTYMDYSTYSYYGVDMNLSEDYRAILWMQSNVQGSPVIVEAAAAGVQYSWHSRFSIYTGLPDVVGWQFHQQQQRVLFSDQVVARGQETDAFYETTDANAARAFLKKYNVRYIIVGQLERAKYTPGQYADVKDGSPNGLLKFDQYNGTLWQEGYRDGQTVIYEVLP